jgi:tripartite-type tricarboxylate transporter receptor subunit TctC
MIRCSRRPCGAAAGRGIAEAVVEPEIKKRLAALGSQPVASAPEALAAHIKKENELWASVVRNLDLSLR